MRDKLAAFLYWAAYWLERAADRVWYGKVRPTIDIKQATVLQRERNLRIVQIMEHKR